MAAAAAAAATTSLLAPIHPEIAKYGDRACKAYKAVESVFEDSIVTGKVGSVFTHTLTDKDLNVAVSTKPSEPLVIDIDTLATGFGGRLRRNYPGVTIETVVFDLERLSAYICASHAPRTLRLAEPTAATAAGKQVVGRKRKADVQITKDSDMREPDPVTDLIKAGELLCDEKTPQRVKAKFDPVANELQITGYNLIAWLPLTDLYKKFKLMYSTDVYKTYCRVDLHTKTVRIGAENKPLPAVPVAAAAAAAAEATVTPATK